uniref:Retrotransposon protein, putative, unclassified n=1 Tax=Oryza sativa subsp. japonica TaxID=39947 RepID=Q2QRU0_ORYSJ|nr:retrotransposon protein, putative, unclassified [Oryza sativa Japonica Group]
MCVFLGYPVHHKGYQCFDPVSNQVIISRHVVFDEHSFPFAELTNTVTSAADLSFLEDFSAPVQAPIGAPRRLQSVAAQGPAPNFSPSAGTDGTASLGSAATHSTTGLASTGPCADFPDRSASSPAAFTRPASPRQPPSAGPGPTSPRQDSSTEPAFSAPQAPTLPSSVHVPRRPRSARHPGITALPSQLGVSPVINDHGMTIRAKAGVRKELTRMNLHATPLSPIPKTYRAALADPNWRSAMEEEYNALLANRTWDLVPCPVKANVVTGKWIFKHKFHADGSLDRYKVRWVLRGFTQRPGVDFDETFSPVIKPATVRTVLSLAVSRDWPVHQLDVKNAFLHGTLQETVYCIQPPGFVDPTRPDMVCYLNKSLYGLKQAPRAWYSRFATYLLSIGFTEAKSDTSLFILHRGTDTVYLLLYVDDIVLTASSDRLLQWTSSALQSEFSMKDLGPLHHFLGISVTRQTSVSNPTDFRSLAGALQYLTFTRPDISYAVQQVCLHMHDPRKPHLAALKRILRYIRGTLDLSLHIQRSCTSDLTVYSDADWAGCPDTRRSMSGYAIFHGDNLVSWSSKRQHTVSRSSAKAEYRAVANSVAEVTWLRQLLHELHSPPSRATLVYCDNVSAVYLSSNPVQHQRTKYVEIDFHFVREKVAVGAIRVLHVPTSSQVDIHEIGCFCETDLYSEDDVIKLSYEDKHSFPFAGTSVCCTKNVIVMYLRNVLLIEELYK